MTTRIVECGSFHVAVSAEEGTIEGITADGLTCTMKVNASSSSADRHLFRGLLRRIARYPGYSLVLELELANSREPRILHAAPWPWPKRPSARKPRSSEELEKTPPDEGKQPKKEAPQTPHLKEEAEKLEESAYVALREGRLSQAIQLAYEALPIRKQFEGRGEWEEGPWHTCLLLAQAARSEGKIEDANSLEEEAKNQLSFMTKRQSFVSPTPAESWREQRVSSSAGMVWLTLSPSWLAGGASPHH